MSLPKTLSSSRKPSATDSKENASPDSSTYNKDCATQNLQAFFSPKLSQLNRLRGEIGNFAKAFAKPSVAGRCAILCAEVTGMSAEEPKAVVRLVGDDLFDCCTPSGHVVAIDTDRKRNSAPSPMELLLLALGSCTGVDVVSILRKKREDLTDYRVEVCGQRREEHPRSYKRMEVHHIVTGRNISDRAVAQAIELSEQKYCSVAATLRPTAEIVSSYEIIEAPSR
ncbi:MAG: OsmC family protein [Pyrinomonadaceae bacterium]